MVESLQRYFSNSNNGCDVFILEQSACDCHTVAVTQLSTEPLHSREINKSNVWW